MPCRAVLCCAVCVSVRVTGLDGCAVQVFPFIEREIGDNNYMLGPSFSATDAILSWEFMLLNHVGLLKERPKLQAYFDRLSSRPSFKAVCFSSCGLALSQ